MTKKLHWFPLYHDAWIVGTRHMAYHEQGIYLNLLLLQFERGNLSMELIERYMPGTDVYRETLAEILEDKFTKLADETYCNERMAAVIQEQQTKSEKRSRQTEAARASKQNKASPATKPVTAIATKPVTERELERELELELELEKEVESLPLQIEQAVQLWNEKAVETGALPSVKRITQARRTKWKRLCQRAGYYNSWREALGRLPVVNNATFRWQPTFDWTLNETNITKLAEGNYGRSDTATRKTRVAKFIDG